MHTAQAEYNRIPEYISTRMRIVAARGIVLLTRCTDRSGLVEQRGGMR